MEIIVTNRSQFYIICEISIDIVEKSYETNIQISIDRMNFFFYKNIFSESKDRSNDSLRFFRSFASIIRADKITEENRFNKRTPAQRFTYSHAIYSHYRCTTTHYLYAK